MKNITVIVLVFATVKLSAQTEVGNINLNHGTSIFCLIRPDAIYIAADTKVRVNNDSSFKNRKIYKTKNIAYCFASLKNPIFNNEEIYNAEKIMDFIINTEDEFYNSFNKFSDSILKRLNALLDTLLTNHWDRLVLEYSTKPVLEFVMTSFLNKKPIFEKKTYTFSNENGRWSVVLHKDLPFVNIIPLGIYDHIWNYLSNNKSFFSGFKNIEEKLICLIGIEAEKHKEDVGFPVDVLILYKNGNTKWILDNQKCTLLLKDY